MDETVTTPDTAPPDTAQAWASLSLAIGDLRQQIAAQQQQRERPLPIRAPLTTAGTVPAAGPLILDLGAPSMGRRWTLRNLSVSDAADVTTAVAGAANVYVGSPHVVSPVAWRWPLAALPAAEKFSSDQLAVIPQDHLLVVVTGATAGQVLLARAEVTDYPLSLPTKTVQGI